MWKVFQGGLSERIFQVYMVPGPEREKKAQVIDKLSGEETEFNFYAYTPERDYSNDFAKGQFNLEDIPED